MYYLQDTLDDDEPYDEVYDTNNLTHDMNTWFETPTSHTSTSTCH